MSVIRTYYTNGKFKEEYYELNGKKKGNIKNITVMDNYGYGKKEGAYKRYYENGQIKETRYYVNDIIEGENIIYYKNGQLSTICNYVNDKKKGNINHIIKMVN